MFCSFARIYKFCFLFYFLFSRLFQTSYFFTHKIDLCMVFTVFIFQYKNILASFFFFFWREKLRLNVFENTEFFFVKCERRNVQEYSILLTAYVQYATEVMTLQVIFERTQSSSQPMESKEDLVWDCFVCAQRAFVTSHFGSVLLC